MHRPYPCFGIMTFILCGIKCLEQARSCCAPASQWETSTLSARPALGLKVEEASAVREWSLQTEHFTECDPRAKLWTRCPRCRRERRARVCQAEVAPTARTCTTSPCRSACPGPTSSTRTDSASTGANWNS